MNNTSNTCWRCHCTVNIYNTDGLCGLCRTQLYGFSQVLSAFEESDIELSERQLRNFIGSGKIIASIIHGKDWFEKEHVQDVIGRYGKGEYSLYYEKYTGDVYRGQGEMAEYINSATCSEMWNYSKRQTLNIIHQEGIGLAIGNELFVPIFEALHRQASLSSAVNAWR